MTSRAGAQDLPLAVPCCLLVLSTFQNYDCHVWVFPFCLSGEKVRYHCECSVFGLKKCMALDLYAGRVPRLRCRMISFPPACCFAMSLEEKGLWGALACLWCSWLVTCSTSVLAALRTAQTELPEIAASCMYCGFVNDKNT